MTESRSKVLKLWMTPAERAVLDKVAAAHGLDRPNLLRMLIAAENRRLLAQPVAPESAEVQ